MSDDYQRCRRCGNFGWTGESGKRFGFHQCPPLFEVRMMGEGDDWREIHARDAEQAAEIFCERRDQNGDYNIIQAGEAEVEVRKFGEDEISQWDISAESVPHYRALARS